MLGDPISAWRLNPAVALRDVFERAIPPERRAPGWDQKWDGLEDHFDTVDEDNSLADNEKDADASLRFFDEDGRDD